MKKLLLFLTGSLLSATSFSQVIFSVENPTGQSYSGPNTDFTYADWGGYDMTIPGNNVVDTVALAVDSLACNALTVDLTGKIALLYRGSCEFGLKALNAENAGAVGVIIVNNIAGAPIAMGAGASGASVTIPVCMVSNVYGATLKGAVQSPGNVVVFMGNKSGFFGDDLGFMAQNASHAPMGATSNLIAQNGTEFSVSPAAWVFNYGINDQTGITLTAAINNGTAVYTEVSPAFDLASGDSIEITFPTYAPASYTNGTYDLSYTLAYGATDEYPQDNSVASDFTITDNLVALARVENGRPVSDGGTRSSTATADFSSCIVFNNANADRLLAYGMYAAASTAAADSLTGLELNVSLFQWDDVFTDLNDAAITAYSEVASGFFAFPDDSYQDSMLFIPFSTQVALDPNQNYLACVTDYTQKIFIGYDSKTKYIYNENMDLQPRYPVGVDVMGGSGQWFTAGFTGSPVPAIGLAVADVNDLGIAENAIEASAFPNPSKDVVTVKVNASGDATLKVTDLAGRTVSTEAVKLVNGQFTTSVSGMNAGQYVFTLNFANGETSRFNVVVAK